MPFKLVRRVVTVALLATFILPGGSIHARRNDDAGCEVAAVAHDSADHRIDGTALPSQAGGDHCAICHWWQSLRVVQTSTRSTSLQDTARAHAFQPQILISLVQSSTLHGRAPPE